MKPTNIDPTTLELEASALASGKRAYCSAACEKIALRKQKREYMRKKRMERGNLRL